MATTGQDSITISEMGDILVNGRTEVKLNLKLKLPPEEGKKPVDVPLQIPLVFNLVGEQKQITVETSEPISLNPTYDMNPDGTVKGSNGERNPDEIGKPLDLEESFIKDAKDFKSEDIDKDLCPIYMNEEITLKLRIPIRIADNDGQPIGKRRFVSIPFKINAKSALQNWQGRNGNSHASSESNYAPWAAPTSPPPTQQEIEDRDIAKKLKKGVLCCGVFS